jgi:nucleotidyltransferase/DNA polymerase involved in DNA repair
MESSAAQPVIFLVDIDAFFAQVEQILRPELRGRPVIVGGLATDRSVVASASYEARARGVKTAMPTREARRLCPDAVLLRGSYHDYARFSDTMMDICRRYTPLVQPVSLDEAYLDVTGCRRLFEAQGIVRAPDAGGVAILLSLSDNSSSIKARTSEGYVEYTQPCGRSKLCLHVPSPARAWNVW